MAPNGRRKAELIQSIENAILDFTANLVSSSTNNAQEEQQRQPIRFSMRNKPKRVREEVDPFEEGQDEDWASEDEQDVDDDEEEDESGSPDLLKTASLRLLAFRLRALSQIYGLLVQNRHATKRDLFYEHKSLYHQQPNFDRALSSICNFLNASRAELHVTSCSRGCAIGDLKLFNALDESEVNFHISPVALYESMADYDFVHSEARFILVVEKDTVFQRLLDEEWTRKFPNSILLTGKGFPDICTRQFLAWLSQKLPKVPILALMDADPYGIQIYLTYKFGCERSKTESGDAKLPQTQWIGFFPSEAEQLAIAENQYLKLLAQDRKRINKMGERVLGLGEQSIFDELSVMLRNDWKLELEALCSLGHHFLSDVYLPNKLLPFL